MTAVCISCILFIRRKCRPFFGPDAFHPPTKEVYHETSETLAGSDGCSGVGPQPADWLLYGGGISSNLLLEVLMGQVENVSVETEPAFDRALKAAVQRGGSDPDAVLNALVEELGITGGTVNFTVSGLNNASVGRQSLDVLFLPGADPTAAANNAAAGWLPTLRSLSGNGGEYSSRVSLVEVNGGCIVAIEVTVEQPGDGGDEPEPVTLKNIAAAVDPAKTYYTDGKFSKSDLTVTASYSNGTTKTLKEDEYKLTIGGAEVTTSYTFNSVGNQTFTIEYGGETTTVTVNVVQSEVASIEVTKKPSKTTYTAGDTFSPTGMKVTVTYNSGKTETIENITTNGDSGVTWEPSEALTINNQSVTIFYQGQEATVEITVNPATVTGIEVTQNPTKMTYISGESFNPAGMTVSEVYSDGTKTAVTDYTYSTAPLTKDTTEVTISYGGESTTVEVTILNGNNSYDAKTKTYSIATADGLMAWNEAVQSDLSLNCTLTEDINMTGKEWTPIGNSFQTYNGTFDGQGYSITSLNASSLFGGIGESATVKNLQLVDVKLYESSGGTAGIVTNNYGQVIACSVTGNINAFSIVGGIANANQGSITACWFAGTLRKNGSGGIVNYNFSIGSITACYWCADTDKGVYNNEGGTVEATKVDDSTVTWQTAVDGMNEALTDNGYQWKLGKNNLPVLQKKQ